jgi:hypothetical protein
MTIPAGLFTGLAKVAGGALHGQQLARDIAEKKKLEDEERKRIAQDAAIKRAALLAGLTQQGIVPSPTANDSGDLTQPTPFTPLGNTGYSLDPSRTPEGIKTKARAATKAHYLALGLTDAQADAALDDPTTARELLKPKLSPPQPVWQREGFASQADYLAFLTGEAKAKAAGQRPTQDPTAVHAANRQYDLAHPTPATGATAKPTEFNQKAALVYSRAAQAAKDLEPFYDSGASARSKLAGVPVVGNYFVSKDEQRLNQAAETVASAILRLESGAAISQSEVRSLAQQLLPQPGDKPEVLQQKRATLRTQIERLRIAAEPALGRESTATGTTPPAGKTHEQHLWDAAVAKHGEAKVLKEYGPRP